MRVKAGRAAVLAVVVTLLCSAPAEAGILSWLSKLSGPGPFLGLDASFALKCFPDESQERSRSRSTTQDPQVQTAAEVRVTTCSKTELEKRHGTLLFVVGAAWSLDNDLDYGGRAAPTVGMFKSGMAFDYTVLPWLDIGAGGGFRYFGGSGFDNFALPYVQPFRLGVRPLLFTGVNWLIVTVNGEFLLGVVDGPRFGATADAFRESNEFLHEWGISVDLPRLLKKKKVPKI